MKKIIRFILIIIIDSGCSQNHFESLDNGISQKIIQLPLEEMQISSGDYFSAIISFGKMEDTPIHSFILYHHNPSHLTIAEKTGERLHPELLKLLISLKEGEHRIFRLPFSYVDDTFLTAYSDSTIASKTDQFELNIQILKVFTEIEFATHLMAMAQHNEISEIEAIELLLLNDTAKAYEKYEDVFIQRIDEQKGINVLKGDSIVLQYQTSLLDNKFLDNPTKLEFALGTAGQISRGVSKALYHCSCGDSVRIFMPSDLAFGVGGSKSEIIPPKSPVVVHLRLQCADFQN